MKSRSYSRFICFAVLAGTFVSVATGKPTRGYQAGPRDTVVLPRQQPEQRSSWHLAALLTAKSAPQRESCRRVGPRDTIVRC